MAGVTNDVSWASLGFGPRWVQPFNFSTSFRPVPVHLVVGFTNEVDVEVTVTRVEGRLTDLALAAEVVAP